MPYYTSILKCMFLCHLYLFKYNICIRAFVLPLPSTEGFYSHLLQVGLCSLSPIKKPPRLLNKNSISVTLFPAFPLIVLVII